MLTLSRGEYRVLTLLACGITLLDRMPDTLAMVFARGMA